MRDAGSEEARARREAADWFTRLSRRSVSTQALQEFRAWRRDPANRAAYERVEAMWNTAGSLAEDPEIQALRRKTRARTAGAARRRRTMQCVAAAGLVGAVVAGFAVYRQLPPSYRTDVGEQRIVQLADGSILRLNTDSRVTVALRKDRRDIRLERGQALFEVAHDPARPFLVHADRTVVRALGTVFDVRRSGRLVDVTLVQGSVRVGAAGRQVTLKPGERVEIRDGEVARATPADARRDLSWVDRRLVFERTPLAAAVKEVNRYSKRKVELEAADLAAAPVNGTFETGDARTFAAAAASVFDLQVVDQGEAAIRLRRPHAAAR
jgi:transmembrane sensor